MRYTLFYALWAHIGSKFLSRVTLWADMVLYMMHLCPILCTPLLDASTCWWLCNLRGSSAACGCINYPICIPIPNLYKICTTKTYIICRFLKLSLWILLKRQKKKIYIGVKYFISKQKSKILKHIFAFTFVLPFY